MAAQRCPRCGKVCSPNGQHAANALRKARQRWSDRQLDAYLCPQGFWHLGHATERDRKAEQRRREQADEKWRRIRASVVTY